MWACSSPGLCPLQGVPPRQDRTELTALPLMRLVYRAQATGKIPLQGITLTEVGIVSRETAGPRGVFDLVTSHKRSD
jgi:hypothetical protein